MYLPPQHIYRVKCQQIMYKQSKCQSLRGCALDRDYWVGRGPEGAKHGAASHLSALGLMPSFAVEIRTHAYFWKRGEIRTFHRMSSAGIHKLSVVSCP